MLSPRETVVVAIFGKPMVEGEPPFGRTVATAAARCGCCARPLAWNLPPGSISTDSTTTAPAIGFGADGCDSTTVGLPGVMRAATGPAGGPCPAAKPTAWHRRRLQPSPWPGERVGGPSRAGQGARSTEQA